MDKLVWMFVAMVEASIALDTTEQENDMNGATQPAGI